MRVRRLFADNGTADSLPDDFSDYIIRLRVQNVNIHFSQIEDSIPPLIRSRIVSQICTRTFLPISLRADSGSASGHFISIIRAVGSRSMPRNLSGVNPGGANPDGTGIRKIKISAGSAVWDSRRDRPLSAFSGSAVRCCENNRAAALMHPLFRIYCVHISNVRYFYSTAHSYRPVTLPSMASAYLW